MAAAVGLRRAWFQDHGTPHYDLCQAKRAIAISLGAVIIDRRGTVELIRKLRAAGIAPAAAGRGPRGTSIAAPAVGPEADRPL